jgi:hypothetical protein
VDFALVFARDPEGITAIRSLQHAIATELKELNLRPADGFLVLDYKESLMALGRLGESSLGSLGSSRGSGLG